MMRAEHPPICPGVVQRLVHPPEQIGYTEWLRVMESPVEWTRDPLEAFVFVGDGQPGGKTGYERAAVVAERLQRELGCRLIYAMTREVKRAAAEPAMPRGFFASGRAEKVERLKRQRTDWRVGVPNCGTD